MCSVVVVVMIEYGPANRANYVHYNHLKSPIEASDHLWHCKPLNPLFCTGDWPVCYSLRYHHVEIDETQSKKESQTATLRLAKKEQLTANRRMLPLLVEISHLRFLASHLGYLHHW